MTRLPVGLRAAFGLAAVFALGTACGGGISPDNQREGEVCTDYSYACNVTGDTVLACDGSNLWRREAACDSGSSCTVAISETEGESVGCLVEGEEASWPEPFMILPAPEETPEEG